MCIGIHTHIHRVDEVIVKLALDLRKIDTYLENVYKRKRKTKVA